MKYLSILLTVVTLTLLVGVAKAGSLNNVRPTKTPLAQKVRNILWQKGVNGTISYQVLHGATPVIVDMAEKKPGKNAKKEKQAVLPEELIRALNKSGV